MHAAGSCHLEAHQRHCSHTAHVFGLLLGARGLRLIEADLNNPFISLIAEATLILVLDSDASRIDLAILTRLEDGRYSLVAYDWDGGELEESFDRQGL